MNDDQLGVALRDALKAPELTADRWAGQRLRRQVRARQDARRGVLVAMSFVVVAVLAVGGIVGVVRGAGTGYDDAGGGGSGMAETGTGPARSSSGPRRLLTPVRVLEVRSVQTPCRAPASAGVVPFDDPAAGCVVAGETVLTIRQVDGLHLVPAGAGSVPVLRLDLLPPDAAGYLAYTRGHVSGRVAFVVDGVTVSAPEILGPVRGPVIDVPAGGRVDLPAVYRRLGGQ